jgi:predicted NAD/FAD-dependent oxidoreductase
MIVIVGGGPAGLYTAYKLLERNPYLRLTILEKDHVWGGRTRMVRYADHWVPGGAGVIRKQDILLRNLCEKMDIPLHFPKKRNKKIHYQGFEKLDVESLVEKWKGFVRREWNDTIRSQTTFLDFLKSRLPTDSEVFRFISSVGYSDYLHADVVDTLEDYGWKDVIEGPDATLNSPINWNSLIHNLREYILQFPNTKAISQASVTKITKNEKGTWSVSYVSNGLDRNVLENVDKIVMAVTSVALETILKESVFRGRDRLLKEIRNNVAMQPFLRMYADFIQKKKIPPTPSPKLPISQISEVSEIPIYTKYPDNPLQKCFPMFDKVWMISYSDNESAERMNEMDSRQIKQWVETTMTGGVQVRGKEKKVFYPQGTHYFKPMPRRWKGDRDAYLRYIQNPVPGLSIVGEGFSRNQGWTEGALESVHKIMGR